MANPFENQKGRYRPLRLVYSGQYAKLWKMRDTREDVDVGLKVLLPSAMRDRKQRALLRHEFELGSTLDFPGLVPAYEWGKEEGCYYYTMEWFPAPSVKGLVLLGYETYAPVLPTLIPMLFEPLLSLAKAGYVHRDVKPDNYLFSPEKGIRLIDYALVQKRGGWWRRLLPKGKVTQGTATYMSPEQIRKDPLDERADLYCLGGTIVELRKSPAIDAIGGIIEWDPELKRYILLDAIPGWQMIETRDCVVIDTEDYGLVAILPIGMSQVCSCNWEEGLTVGSKVEKGDPMGYFLFGGSDIVMVFQSCVNVDFLCEAEGTGYAHIMMGQAYANLTSR